MWNYVAKTYENTFNYQGRERQKSYAFSLAIIMSFTLMVKIASDKFYFLKMKDIDIKDKESIKKWMDVLPKIDMLLFLFMSMLLLMNSLAYIALMVRRLHDCGVSGSWVILILLLNVLIWIPFYGGFFLGLIPGQKKRNAYGPV